jgi:thioredoxin 1
MSLPTISDLDALQREIQSGAPVLVDFWAEWCSSCKAMMPLMEECQRNLPAVRFLKCDLDATPAIGEAFGVTSLPTLLLFKGGHLVNRQVGSASRGRLNDFLEAAI